MHDRILSDSRPRSFRFAGLVGACLAILLVAPPTARSQAAPEYEASNGAADGGADVLGLWHVETMLEQACRGITQRYNLNPHQERFTRAIMTRHLKSFLKDHEGELRRLLREMIAARLTGKANADAAKRWAEQAKPIFDAAEQTILEGNETWRQILTDEQKTIHDRDLREMELTFRQLGERFDRWARGDFDLYREGFARRARSAGDAEGGPRRELANMTRTSVGPSYSANREDAWEAYVRRFIQEYQLDESQTQSALAILAEEKDRAVQFRQANADETERIRVRLRELAASNASVEERIKAQQELRDLSRPVIEIYNELRARLNAIPTQAQKTARDERVQSRIQDRMSEIRQRDKAQDKAGASTGATQPPPAAPNKASKSESKDTASNDS